ncbi:glycoside hydrolase family 130 protein [Larkinella bovis]|uniref:Glycoside hydrolase family 130 protein n=1 Tax=Larkinella bovis TaxID=683041 RepID=A0ABW0I6D2_9BACT
MKNYQLRRLSDQPIVTATDVKPSHPHFQVLGAFNPAACRFGDEILLLLRVAEAVEPRPGTIQVPIVQELGGHFQLVIKTFPEPEGPYDPRIVQLGDQAYLTSLSHLRLARSRDGLHFTVDEKPFIFPDRADESFGVEDARITYLDGHYWITYTAVSENGPGVGLITTTDFVHFDRKGMIVPPPNKDACLFPQKINGFYYLLHRPMVSDIGKPAVWLARSPDGVHWSDHRFLFGATGTVWEHLKIGTGPEPLLTDDGWLVCYHGTSVNHEYSLALALLDRDDPTRVLDRSATPLLMPELPWEKVGFFPEVVFSNGWVQLPDGRILVYYGAADYCVGVAELVRG